MDPENIPSVTCTWGEAEDICISLEGCPLICLEDPTGKDHWVHGVVHQGQIALTARQARLFARELNRAAAQAEQMEKELEQYEGEGK